jgi:protein TonB
MRTTILCLLVAAGFHAGLILFGKLLFVGVRHAAKAPVQVELESEAAAVAKPDPDPAKQTEKKAADAEKQDAVADREEPPPNAAEVIRDLEPDVAKLEAASLSAIEDALRGNAVGGGGEFAEALTFASGGRIGGTAMATDGHQEQAFSMAEIDEKPRAIFQSPPAYPAEMRVRRVEGFVQVAFIVDATGRVTDARTEKCSDPAFEKPALDAVHRWRFEPAVKGGQRVQCRMRVPIRFQPA